MLFRDSWENLRSALDSVQAAIEYDSIKCFTDHLCPLLIVGEDHRFYWHPGVDPIGLSRAFWKTVFCRERQGGSTIAMQLVRTLTGRYEKTLYRKLREIVLAIRMTRYLGRKHIPVIYIWVAYYGSDMTGFQQACSQLGFAPNSMTDLDAAKLVARLKYPQPREYNSQWELRIRLRALHLLKRRQKISLLHSRKQGINGTISNFNANNWAN